MLRHSVLTIILFGSASVFSEMACFAQARPLTSMSAQESVRRFLQERDSRSGSYIDKTAYYVAAFVDLDDSGKQDVIVHFTYSRWGCGTAGCTTLVLVPHNSSYKVVSRIVATRPPIRVLVTKSHGWHDIAVRSQWDGEPAREVKLSFDGKSYPFSTSSPRVHRLAGKALGEVVVPLAASGVPLY